MQLAEARCCVAKRLQFRLDLWHFAIGRALAEVLIQNASGRPIALDRFRFQQPMKPLAHALGEVAGCFDSRINHVSLSNISRFVSTHSKFCNPLENYEFFVWYSRSKSAAR